MARTVQKPVAFLQLRYRAGLSQGLASGHTLCHTDLLGQTDRKLPDHLGLSRLRCCSSRPSRADVPRSPEGATTQRTSRDILAPVGAQTVPSPGQSRVRVRSKSTGVIPSSQAFRPEKGKRVPVLALGTRSDAILPLASTPRVVLGSGDPGSQAMPLRGLQRAWGRGESRLTWVRDSSPGGSGVRAAPVSFPPPSMRAASQAAGH